MASLRKTVLSGILVAATAIAILTAAPMSAAGQDQVPAAPCYNGVFPLNPDVDNCAVPNRPPRVLGSAPDQTAILACGHGPFRSQCLSLYVNGGYGLYPGAVLVPGYHP